MRVCQLSENLMPGDAISDNVLALDTALGALGYETALCAAHDLRRDKRPRAAQPGALPALLREEDLLLYQYSTGSPLNDWFRRQRCRKAIVYQNITPARFFERWDAKRADAARLGREQLAEILPALDFAVASSAYSASELTALGCRDVSVLPVLLDFARYETPPDARLLARLRDGKKNLLFVGRKAPNKCIEDLLLAADYYAAAYQRPCRLVLAGDESMRGYCAALGALRAKLAVEVVWLGRVSAAALNACYRAADVFLCLSEHEGFCVPLVECMVFGVPVLAYAAAAVPETLGSGGVLAHSKDYALLARELETLLTDAAQRERLAAAQRARLAEFAPERVRARLGEILRAHLQKE